MINKQICKSILHTKVESFILGAAVIDYIQNYYPYPDEMIEERQNQYIQENLKTWNRMNDDARKVLRDSWLKEAALLSYLLNFHIAEPDYTQVTFNWNYDEADQLLGCDIRLFYSEMGVNPDQSGQGSPETVGQV